MYTSFGNERQTIFVENARLNDLQQQIEAGKLADQIDAATVAQAARRIGQVAVQVLSRFHRGQASQQPTSNTTVISADAR